MDHRVDIAPKLESFIDSHWPYVKKACFCKMGSDPICVSRDFNGLSSPQWSMDTNAVANGFIVFFSGSKDFVVSHVDDGSVIVVRVDDVSFIVLVCPQSGRFSAVASLGLKLARDIRSEADGRC